MRSCGGPIRAGASGRCRWWRSWLLGLIAAAGQGSTGELLDYKILLPILALLVAPSLRAALGDLAIVRVVLRAGGVYVLATAAVAMLAPSAATLRNVAEHVRIDLTGSVVLHASLCTIVAVAAFVGCAACRRPGRRLLLALVVVAAACMVLLTGTRTALVTLLFLAVLAIRSGTWQPLARPRLLFLCLAVLGGLVLLSMLVGDTLWSRLVELDRADYSSGRWPSIGHWLALSGGAPFGLGMGTIRATLADGRPLIGDGQLLEWPHNELVRFYVEAGVPGVVLVLLLLGEVTRLALRQARITGDPAERALLLVIAADLWAQCLFQNYFNGVYQATVLILLVGVLAAGGAGREPRPAAGPPGWPGATPLP
ncbi:MAG: hypothetical protein R3D25_07430 [Geminicoccaceae bacterium]